MPPTRGEQGAGGRVPQARALVFADRGKAGAVRAEGQTPDQAVVAVADRRRPAGRRVAQVEPPPIALGLDPRDPGAVRAEGEQGHGSLGDVRATEEPAGLVEQVEVPAVPDGDP